MKALKFSGDYDIIIERGKNNLYSQFRKMEILCNKEGAYLYDSGTAANLGHHDQIKITMDKQTQLRFFATRNIRSIQQIHSEQL